MQTPTVGRILLVRELAGQDEHDKPQYRISPAIVTDVAKNGSVAVHVFTADKSGLEVFDSLDAADDCEDDARAAVVACWPAAPAAPAAKKAAAPAKDKDPAGSDPAAPPAS